MDNLNNESSTMTLEDRDKLIAALEEEVETNENLKVLRELPSNQGVEEHEPEEGHAKRTMVNVNPFTGESTPVPNSKDIPEETKSMEDVLEDMGDALNNSIVEDENVRVDINVEDVKAFTQNEETVIGKYDISDETALELIKVINKKQDGQDIKYKDLPEEVKQYIDKYLSQNGVSGYSNQSNYIRNELSNNLIDEFIVQIGLSKISDDFNKQIEGIYEQAGKDMSPLFKEYNDNRAEYLEKMTANIEDEEKKKLAEAVLDSIHDAYSLNRIKNSPSKIKIKSYALEEPEKIYRDLEFKYKDNKNTIFKPSVIEAILDRHLKLNKMIEEDDVTTAKLIVLAFCIFTQNYDANKPVDHAFMYYFTYNVVLLDIYKGEEYDNYAKDFLNNVMGILGVIKQKQ